MSKFRLIADTASELTPALAEKLGVTTVPFYSSFDGATYRKEHIEITTDQFYEEFAKSPTTPKTSLPSSDDYQKIFRPFLENGEDILCICISSKLSGSSQSAFNAASMLSEEFPERKIQIFDSYTASGGQAAYVFEAIKLRDKDASLEEAYETLEKLKEYSLILFAVDELETLKKGGRIGGAASLVGTMLNVKPILTVVDGAITAHAKVRGRKKALNLLVSELKEFTGGNFNEYTIVPFASMFNEEFDSFIQMLYDAGVQDNLEETKVRLNCTIGAHIGPTGIAIAAVKKQEYL